jgi:hypothetical protein
MHAVTAQIKAAQQVVDAQVLKVEQKIEFPSKTHAVKGSIVRERVCYLIKNESRISSNPALLLLESVIVLLTIFFVHAVQLVDCLLPLILRSGAVLAVSPEQGRGYHHVRQVLQLQARHNDLTDRAGMQDAAETRQCELSMIAPPHPSPALPAL